MNTMHTPGPWNAKITESGAMAIFNTGGIWIAQTLRRQWKTEDAANANLIAAAPELLEALEKLLAATSGHQEFRDAAYAAINKAKGL